MEIQNMQIIWPATTPSSEVRPGEASVVRIIHQDQKRSPAVKWYPGISVGEE
jgi:hypothetical protein